MDHNTYSIITVSDIIKKRAKFLEKKGFKFYNEDQCSINYRSYKRDVEVKIFFDRYTNVWGGVLLVFNFSSSFKKDYFVHVFDIVTRLHNNEDIDFREILKTKLDGIMKDLDFLEKHFAECMDLEYCERMEKQYLISNA